MTDRGLDLMLLACAAFPLAAALRIVLTPLF